MARMTSLEVAKLIASSYNVPMKRTSLRRFADVLSAKKYKKGDSILEEGQVCTALLFVEKGMTRQFYFKHGKDLTEHIAYEGGVVVCLESYLKEEPTRLMIEALETSILWEVPKVKMEELAMEDFDIGLVYRRFFEISLIISQVKADALRFESAMERYQKMAEKHPEILRRAPLIYIASLLQMTPETLSRVRSTTLSING